MSKFKLNYMPVKKLTEGIDLAFGNFDGVI